VNEMKKVLVVGGAGYVGSVLVQELLARGYSVRVLDRMYFGEIGIKQYYDQIETVFSDIRVVSMDVFAGVDAVINLGGLSNDPTADYNPQANHEMNTVAAKTLAVMAKSQGIRRYVYASSCSIYDRGVNCEEKDVLQDEQSEVDPRAAYSVSKYQAEHEIARLVDQDFCPVFLRKGTLYGFSPRMRYDLVVNTFIKDAITKGKITIHYGGEMWRPLADVRDAARAYIALIEADEDIVRGQLYNLVYTNIRVSELAFRVQKALSEIGIKAEIGADYSYTGVRSYRVSGQKISHVLGFQATISVEESVKDMVEKIRQYNYMDFENPRYYNIRWMKLLEEAHQIIKITGSVFEAPASQPVLQQG
jgi:nucleoside-diphosphate-sugar epimerase